MSRDGGKGMRRLEFDVMDEEGMYVRTLLWEQRPDRPIEVEHLRLYVESELPQLAGTGWRMAIFPHRKRPLLRRLAERITDKK